MARRAAADHDPSRREFFKTFSRQTIQNAGAVAGAASGIRRSSLAAARELLDMDAVATAVPTTRTVVTPPPTNSAPHETFRSAYRFTGDRVVVLDQRELPERVITFECETAADVASALRSRAVTPGPVMSQIAAYGVALAAIAAADRPADAADSLIRTAADTIKAARGELHAVRHAVVNMVARYDELANAGATSTELRDGLVAAADDIAADGIMASAEIGRLWAGLLLGDEVSVLMHGDSGPLACGVVGMSTAALQTLVDSGRRVHVWVTDGAPTNEGTRITALQLTQSDIPHTVIPDSAVGWLFASRRIGAVVLRGDTVCSNGDTVALLGALSAAQLAHEAGVSVHVLAPDASRDHKARDAHELVLDLRSAAELGSASRARLNPPFDVVPARLVSAYISERGIARPSFEEPH